VNPIIPDIKTLLLVSPELALVLGVVCILIAGIVRQASPRNLLTISGLAALACAGLAVWTTKSLPETGAIFSGMLSIDPFSQYFKAILGLFLVLVIFQWAVLTRREDVQQSGPDFLALVLGAAVGMALMASASNLLMVFLATETASFPSYALAGFRKRSRSGSEAAVKYVMFGAVSSAVTVFGMSLVYSATGTLDLAACLKSGPGITSAPILAVGLALSAAGMLFKIASVPMHFWCPDVFQAAPTPVTTLLSVASKGAGICVLMRAVTLAGSPGEPSSGLLFAAWAISILGLVSATLGNLLALVQTDFKRLLAYSSIAHAGYMVSAAGVMLLADPGTGTGGRIVGAVLFYLTVYLFMNVAALTVAGLIAQMTGSYDIRTYAGIPKKAPILFVGMLVATLSLFGLPTLGGFMAKLYLLTGTIQAGTGALAYVVVAGVLVNSLLSLYFYLRPVYYMALAPDLAADKSGYTKPWPLSPASVLLVGVCSAAILALGLVPGVMMDCARDMAVIRFTPGKVKIKPEALFRVPDEVVRNPVDPKQ
jgi:NADH-quinone oxidoreductase subunit N